MSKVAAILRAHDLARRQKVRRAHTQVETLTEEQQSAYDWKMFQHDLDMDGLNIIPDRLGKTGEYEPKSIHSPAPPSRFQVERPRARRKAERNDRDCELPPDPRRRGTVTVVDDTGRVTATIRTNPYTRTIAITGHGLTQGLSIAEKRKAR